MRVDIKLLIAIIGTIGMVGTWVYKAGSLSHAIETTAQVTKSLALTQQGVVKLVAEQQIRLQNIEKDHDRYEERWFAPQPRVSLEPPAEPPTGG